MSETVSGLAQIKDAAAKGKAASKKPKGGAKAKAKAKDAAGEGATVIPFSTAASEPLVVTTIRDDYVEAETLEPSRSLVLSEYYGPDQSIGETLMRYAYSFGVPASFLLSPFGKKAKPKLLAIVKTPLEGNRASGVALRAGHFFIHGVKIPIGQMDFAPKGNLSPCIERVAHGFTWLRDLAVSAPAAQCAPIASRIMASWMAANPKPNKLAAWKIENVGNRLLQWLIFAPLILTDSNEKLVEKRLDLIATTARWLDRNVKSAKDRPGEIAGWCGVIAAGLLLPEGRPRRLYGEAGLLSALGEFIADDGGNLGRNPLIQMDLIALLTDLRSCYQARDIAMPEMMETVLQSLVPPLLNLVHTDGALGSWQGSGATGASQIAALVEASGTRARALQDVKQWGYQRVIARKSSLLFDCAPPPHARYAKYGSASSLAFEFCANEHRLIVNCGGSYFAGGQVPKRTEQGLRASAAHSTLVLDDMNSTAVLPNGRLGTGVEEVEVERRLIKTKQGNATQIEASHDGYSARYGLLHRRTLIMRDDGSELRGEDVLLPNGKKGKNGKVKYAIRFHIGPGVELRLSEDGKGAAIAMPDSSYWQFRFSDSEGDAQLVIRDSMWVDGEGQPRATEQLVIQGLASRGGGSFSWLFKKMG